MKQKSNKPEPLKAAVVAKTLAGQSKTKIGNDLGIARQTVARILNEAELNELVGQGKSGIYNLIPKSVLALEKALDKGDTSEAKVILRAVGVLPNEQAMGSSAGSLIQFVSNVNFAHE